MLLVKIGKYIGFCLYRRSYLLWFHLLSSRFLSPPNEVKTQIRGHIAGGYPLPQTLRHVLGINLHVDFLVRQIGGLF